jgi:hypothetical protein
MVRGHVTEEQAQELSRNKGVTFKPLRGGRYICNQLPHLGKLSKKDVESVRNAALRFRVEAIPPKVSQPAKVTSKDLLAQAEAHRRSMDSGLPNCERMARRNTARFGN